MKRNRIIIALMISSVALLATSVSFSFAWYASATNLRIEMITLENDPNRSLTVATAEDGEYKDKLFKDELKPVGFFAPVTAAYSSKWRGVKPEPVFYDMSYSWSSKGEPRLVEGYTDSYYTQELYLKCDTNAYVGIDIDQTTIKPNKEKNAVYAAQLVDQYGDRTQQEYEDRLNLAHLSGRVSVLVDDQFAIIDPNANEDEVIYGGALDNTNTGEYDTYQDSEDGRIYEVAYGEIAPGASRDDLVYDYVEQDIVPEGERNAFDATHVAGTYALNLQKSKNLFTKEARYTAEDLDSRLEMPAFNFEMTAYTPKRIVVSFFMEGWDLDSINGAMGSSFDIALSFRIIRER